MTKLTTLEVVDMLIDAYGFRDNKITPKTVHVYVETLKDLDPVVLRMAALEHVTNNKWFPAVAELRNAVTALHEQAAGIIPAGEAWGIVINNFSKARSRMVPLDALTQKTVDAMGGLSYLGYSTNQVSDRARFIELYDQFLKRERTDIQQLPTVRRFVDEQRNDRLLAMNEQMKQLTEKLEVNDDC